jgi:hypothetical protein
MATTLPTMAQCSEPTDLCKKLNDSIELAIKQTYPRACKFNHTLDFKADGENRYVGSFFNGANVVNIELTAPTLPELIELVIHHFLEV